MMKDNLYNDGRQIDKYLSKQIWLPSISGLQDKEYQYNRNLMQDSVKHLHFLTKVTGILADTFGDIHKMLQQEVKNVFPRNNHHVQLSSSERAPEELPLSISNSENNQNDENEDEAEIDQENRSYSSKARKPFAKEFHTNKQKKIEKKKKTAKWQAEGKPRPPLNAFMLFLKASKSEIMQARPQLTPAEVSTYASSLWGDLANEEKQKYRNQYRENRLKYKEVMDEYNKNLKQPLSPAGRKKRNNKGHMKSSKNQGGQQVVNIESDQDNSGEI